METKSSVFNDDNNTYNTGDNNTDKVKKRSEKKFFSLII